MINGEWSMVKLFSAYIHNEQVTVDKVKSELLQINGAFRFALGKLATEAQSGFTSPLTTSLAKHEISFYLLFLNQNQLL